jgi:hypothetical protein
LFRYAVPPGGEARALAGTSSVLPDIEVWWLMSDGTSRGPLVVVGAVLALSGAALLGAWSSGSWSAKVNKPARAVVVHTTQRGRRNVPPVGVAWSNDVLALAAVPPGAKATTVAVPTLRAPGQSLSGHQVEVHRLYLVPGTRATVAAYLLHHLPRGGSANQGDMIQTDPVSYDAEFIPVTMAAQGPNEDAATLLYAFAADGPGIQELRVDAETVSVPDRTAASEAAPTGRVVVTGYGESSLSGGTSNPVSVTLTGSKAQLMRSVFDRLGLAQPPDCMEYSGSFELQFFDPGSSSPAQSATGSFCAGAQVAVATGHRLGISLSDPHCLLLGAVVRSLPAGTGSATRGALRECRLVYVG